MKHPTTDHDGKKYPVPGKWSLNWVEGDVIAWRHDADPAERVHKGGNAYVYICYPDNFGDPAFDVRIDEDRVRRIESDEYDDRDDVFDMVGDVLAQYTDGHHDG